MLGLLGLARAAVRLALAVQAGVIRVGGHRDTGHARDARHPRQSLRPTKRVERMRGPISVYVEGPPPKSSDQTAPRDTGDSPSFAAPLPPPSAVPEPAIRPASPLANRTTDRATDWDPQNMSADFFALQDFTPDTPPPQIESFDPATDALVVYYDTELHPAPRLSLTPQAGGDALLLLDGVAVAHLQGGAALDLARVTLLAA